MFDEVEVIAFIITDIKALAARFINVITASSIDLNITPVILEKLHELLYMAEPLFTYTINLFFLFFI